MQKLENALSAIMVKNSVDAPFEQMQDELILQKDQIKSRTILVARSTNHRKLNVD